MSDYVEHLRRCAAGLNERAEILHNQAQILAREANALEREARDLFLLAVVEMAKRWLRKILHG